MELDLLRRRAEKITNNTGTNEDSLNGEFRLLSESSFSCSGNVTGLLLVGAVRTDEGRDQYPEIQIWSPPQKNMYTRKGREKIMLAEGDFSPDGVLQYNLNTSLSFQSGDVLGVYQPPKNASVVRVYYDSSESTTYQLSKNESSESVIKILGNTKTFNDQLILISPISGQ